MFAKGKPNNEPAKTSTIIISPYPFGPEIGNKPRTS